MGFAPPPRGAAIASFTFLRPPESRLLFPPEASFGCGSVF